MIASQTDDLTLWRLLCEGDEDAFEQIMGRYYRTLFRYGVRIWADEDRVRDSIQEIFLDIWARRALLKQVRSVHFYLIKALRNRLLYERRQQKTVNLSADWPEGEAFVSELTIEHDLINTEEVRLRAQKLETLLNSLPPRQREIIHLRFFQDLTHDEIAEIMALNRQSVYNLLHETLRKLRGLWGVLLLIGSYLTRRELGA
ncbi:sigma-70 family RNA polymerase sigma factor [Rhabdobacter roseus]|uniref:RNA polymerase sigma factor (Sigma-70 family) n=1 Tax=Rhabdobacter roseus TaxID=1655419 RepID=A0A840TUM0_9BACT|nr:sigma-70 family RNA polymerase sigma factor [Rhabdobacter roseus]MBB5283758.1 RNA polymerase sigma factor (sigma-70 family) [Rhabdobacter roseus]